ncbi:MAG: hypothetical protein KTR25_08755 [Myxococcales bacterium]|nr:hypothetical protein [Myxococcales bacterium]
MKGPDHKTSLLGHVPPGTLASSSERLTKAGLDSYTHGQINRLLGRVFNPRTAFKLVSRVCEGSMASPPFRAPRSGADPSQTRDTASAPQPEFKDTP